MWLKLEVKMLYNIDKNPYQYQIFRLTTPATSFDDIYFSAYWLFEVQHIGNGSVFPESTYHLV